MGQHRRFPGGFLLVVAVLAIPSLLYGFVTAAERADECVAVAKAGNHAEHHKQTSLKCE